MTFGEAIEELKAGRRVARSGWNGKGMWLALQVPDGNSKMTLPYIYMRTAGDVGDLVPWLASQTDILSEDWSVLTEGKKPHQMQTECGLAETIHGTPIGEHLAPLPSGQQKDYVVLTAEERAKGFVEPVRRAYRHETCGSITTMSVALAETYARCPDFYSGTFCANCGNHFPVGAAGEFVWAHTDQKVGTRAPAKGAI